MPGFGANQLTSQELMDEPILKLRKDANPNGTDVLEEIFHIVHPFVVPAEEYLRHFPEIRSKSPYIFTSPKVLIGVEVEAENVIRINPNLHSPTLWAIKDDGSLRNHGREFVTPGVIPASAAEDSLRFLFSEINQDIDFSKRTSIHVHMDVRQLQFKQLLGLLFTYSVVENLLFQFVGNNRRNNIFCVPIIETSIMEKLSKNPVASLTHISTHWHKYSALNLLPISRWGSIEFRHMPGTTNIMHIIQWIDLITSLKVFAYRYTLEEIVDRIIALNSNSRYQQFVESVFGEKCVYLNMSNLLNDMEKAVYLVKHCAFTNTFHKLVTNTVNYESRLGRRLNSWLRKLTNEQRVALERCAHHIGYDDLEYIFHEIIRHPNAWIKHPIWPDVETIMKIDPELQAKLSKKKVIKKTDPIIYYYNEPVQATQWTIASTNPESENPDA